MGTAVRGVGGLDNTSEGLVSAIEDLLVVVKRIARLFMSLPLSAAPIP